MLVAPGSEPAAEHRRETACLEPVLVSPLPLCTRICRVPGLVVGGIQVVHTGFKAGVHDRQVLVGQRDIDNQLGLLLCFSRAANSATLSASTCRVRIGRLNCAAMASHLDRVRLEHDFPEHLGRLGARTSRLRRLRRHRYHYFRHYSLLFVSTVGGFK